jgi:hypothetical protein
MIATYNSVKSIPSSKRAKAANSRLNDFLYVLLGTRFSCRTSFVCINQVTLLFYVYLISAMKVVSECDYALHEFCRSNHFYCRGLFPKYNQGNLAIPKSCLSVNLEDILLNPGLLNRIPHVAALATGSRTSDSEETHPPQGQTFLTTARLQTEFCILSEAKILIAFSQVPACHI